MGHLGYERTLELIRERFYWPQINDVVKNFVGKICVLRIRDQLDFPKLHKKVSHPQHQ